MEQASQPRELQAPNSRIRRAVSRPWDFLRAHLRPVCQYVRRQFNRHSAADDAARTLARRKAHLQILQANFHPDVVKSLQETPWLAAHLAAGEDTWDESQKTFPDRVACHVLLRLQMHNLNFVERAQMNRPARSVRHLESIMELVFVDEVARKMAAGMREAWWDSEGVVKPNYWWPPVELRGNLSKGRTIHQVHLRDSTAFKAWKIDEITSELSEWFSLSVESGPPDVSLPQTWTPAMARNLCVYHGTADAYNYECSSRPNSLTNLKFASVIVGYVRRTNLPVNINGPVDQKTLKYGRSILFEVEPPRRLASCRDHIKKSDPFSAMKK
ncbi:hypothetical protein CcaCcLH18_06457 [Colletotrichum camelliae]|nr:hypothetical protein CcaCcLH18_06457 [Colletotrichum camelliae]